MKVGDIESKPTFSYALPIIGNADYNLSVMGEITEVQLVVNGIIVWSDDYDSSDNGPHQLHILKNGRPFPAWMIGTSDVYLSVRVSGKEHPSLMMEEVKVDRVNEVFTDDIIQAKLSMEGGKMVVKLVEVSVVDYEGSG